MNKAAAAFGEGPAAFAAKWTERAIAGEAPGETGVLDECLVDEGQVPDMALSSKHAPTKRSLHVPARILTLLSAQEMRRLCRAP